MDTPEAVSVAPEPTVRRRRVRKVEAPKQNLILYNPQGNVPLSERKTAALELMTCREPEVVMKGPARTGKSLAMLHRGNALLCHFPGCRGLFVRKTRSSLTESGLVTYETQVVPRNLSVYPDTKAQQRKIRHSYEYPNGSVLVVAGMDTPERILSTEYDFIMVQEATELTQHDWELLITRLSGNKATRILPDGRHQPLQQIMGDMNPTYPNHWINRRISEGKIKMLYSRHEDNPRWWDGTKWTPEGEALRERLQRTTGVRFLRYFKGVDAAAEGIVYGEFDPAKHISMPFEIDPSWRRFRAIDFGFRHPFCCQWWALDGDGKAYCYREIYHSERIVEDHAKQIIKLSAGEKYEATISDHSASDRATLHKAGIKTIPAVKFEMLKPGIEAVTERLRDGRIVFFRDGEINGVKYGRVERDSMMAEQARPTSTIEEFDMYSYPAQKEGQAGKEDPVKEYDDGMDAMRYFISHVDEVARRRFKLRGGRVGKTGLQKVA